jgi:hypothetical protein
MIATLRRLEVPLDYQVEEGTLVITAHLDAASRSAGGGDQLISTQR